MISQHTSYNHRSILKQRQNHLAQLCERQWKFMALDRSYSRGFYHGTLHLPDGFSHSFRKSEKRTYRPDRSDDDHSAAPAGSFILRSRIDRTAGEDGSSDLTL